MKREEIRRIVREIVTDVLELKPEELTDDGHFEDDFGADSLKKLGLIAALEKRFDTRYALLDAQNMNCINEVVEVTANNVNG